MGQKGKSLWHFTGEIDRSKHQSEVFRDFCEMAYCALSKQVCMSKEEAESREAQYMGVVSRYRNKEDLQPMSELLGLAVMGLNRGGVDFLGHVAAEMGVLDASLGQFFTPYEVSKLMTEITFTGLDKTIESEGFMTVQEPAVGAGGMLLAMADVVEDQGFDPALNVWIDATELSCSTFYMAYVQLALRGLSGVVRHENSITMEEFTVVYLPSTPFFPAKNGNPFAKQKAEQIAAEEQAQVIAAAEKVERRERFEKLANSEAFTGKQMVLFD